MSSKTTTDAIEEMFTIEPFPSRRTGTKAWLIRNTLTGSAGAGRRDHSVVGARRRLRKPGDDGAAAFAQCVRSHGLPGAPATAEAFSLGWGQGDHQPGRGEEGDGRLRACKMQLDPGATKEAKPGACGDDATKSGGEAARPEETEPAEPSSGENTSTQNSLEAGHVRTRLSPAELPCLAGAPLGLSGASRSGAGTIGGRNPVETR
jgi:hypothetical protein